MVSVKEGSSYKEEIQDQNSKLDKTCEEEGNKAGIEVEGFVWKIVQEIDGESSSLW